MNGDTTETEEDDETAIVLPGSDAHYKPQEPYTQNIHYQQNQAPSRVDAPGYDAQYYELREEQPTEQGHYPMEPQQQQPPGTKTTKEKAVKAPKEKVAKEKPVKPTKEKPVKEKLEKPKKEKVTKPPKKKALAASGAPIGDTETPLTPTAQDEARTGMKHLMAESEVQGDPVLKKIRTESLELDTKLSEDTKDSPDTVQSANLRQPDSHNSSQDGSPIDDLVMDFEEELLAQEIEQEVERFQAEDAQASKPEAIVSKEPEPEPEPEPETEPTPKQNQEYPRPTHERSRSASPVSDHGAGSGTLASRYRASPAAESTVSKADKKSEFKEAKLSSSSSSSKEVKKPKKKISDTTPAGESPIVPSSSKKTSSKPQSAAPRKEKSRTNDVDSDHKPASKPVKKSPNEATSLKKRFSQATSMDSVEALTGDGVSVNKHFKSDKHDRQERSDKQDRQDKSDKHDKHDKYDKHDKHDKHDRHDRFDKYDKYDKHEDSDSTSLGSVAVAKPSKPENEKSSKHRHIDRSETTIKSHSVSKDLGEETSSSRGKPSSSAKEEPKKESLTTMAKQEEKGDDLYCICRAPYDPTRFMIACDGCDDWFHGDCVGVAEKDSELVDKYYCKRCEGMFDVMFSFFFACLFSLLMTIFL